MFAGLYNERLPQGRSATTSRTSDRRRRRRSSRRCSTTGPTRASTRSPRRDETGSAFGRKNGEQHRGDRARARRRPSAWSGCRATRRCAPTRRLSGQPRSSPTCRRTSPRSRPSPASRTRCAPSTCSPTCRARTSPGTRRCVGVQGQPVLPDDRGVHPAGHPRQRPRRVVRAADRRDHLGRRGPRHRASRARG